MTLELAGRFPGYVPAPLAVEAERGWLLFAEFDDLVGWRAPLETRCELFRRFAGLQRRSASTSASCSRPAVSTAGWACSRSQLDPLFADPVAVARLTPEETAS